MTTPANFPVRANDRRVAALHRIERHLASDVKRNDGCELPLTAGDRSRLIGEANALGLRIRPTNILAAIRTKKQLIDGSEARRLRHRGKITR